VSWGDPPAASPEVSARMRRVRVRVRVRDTAPELALRRELHRRGLRYRVDHPLPLEGVRRRSDLTFPGARLVVFVDGCYWHGCQEHFRPSGANRDWWVAKIERTRARDADTDRRLAEMGWAFLRMWEHDDPVATADEVERMVRPCVRA
jgi:DNA mismatch endonuclease (patch repair protein)